jgi:phage shock protein E
VKRAVVAVLILVSLLFVACRRVGAPPNPTAAPTALGGVGKTMAAPGGSYTLLTVGELHALLQHKDFLLVNVHVPYYGEIEPTDLFIPYDQIDKHLDQLPAKDARIVLYCRSGNMSNQAVHVLVGLGYTNLFDVDGGMVAWEAAGYPLLKKAQ